VSPDHPIFDAASKAAPSDAADVTRLLTAIVRVCSAPVSHDVKAREIDRAAQVRHREAAHVVKKTKVSLLPLLPHANENQLGQLAQVGDATSLQPHIQPIVLFEKLTLSSGRRASRGHV
jgi:hypothetical protein